MIIQWQRGFEKPILKEDEVHIWLLSLPIKPAIFEKFKANLSHDELERVNRFHFDKDKETFLTSRGGLRDILARYVNRAPNEIEVSYAEFGKPFLSQNKVHFNVSHAHDTIIIAISKLCPVGIDIELCRESVDFLSIAEYCFTQNEYRKLLKLASSDRLIAFYRCWTRKEAVLKAMGKGLFHSMKELEVSFLPEEHIQLIHFGNEMQTQSSEKRPWYLAEIKVSAEYIGALATQQNYRHIQFFHWESEILA